MILSDGVPSGYRGPNGVVLIDPASVKTPYNKVLAYAPTRR